MSGKRKYASPVTSLNASIPVTIKEALKAALPEGISLSEFVSEVLAERLGVKINRPEAGKLCVCKRCQRPWMYEGMALITQTIRCPSCSAAQKLGYAALEKVMPQPPAEQISKIIRVVRDDGAEFIAFDRFASEGIEFTHANIDKLKPRFGKDTKFLLYVGSRTYACSRRSWETLPANQLLEEGKKGI